MELQHPSDKQKSYAVDIARGLEIVVPDDVLVDSRACSAFIKKYQPEFEKKRKEQQTKDFCDWANKDPIMGAELKTKIRNAGSVGSALKVLREHPSKPQQPSATPEGESSASTMLKYWRDGLVRAAFDNLGKLPNLLEGPPVPPSEIEQALLNRHCKGIKAGAGEVPVRHLVLRLDVSGSSDSGYRGSPPIAVSVLPLGAVFETRTHDIEKEAASPAYRWEQPENELPLFNHRLLGEDVDIDGLLLDQPDALTSLLADAVVDENSQTTKRDLTTWLGFLDECFDALTGSGEGMLGWEKLFLQQRKLYPRLRNRVPVFVLVDGGAASGATKQIRSCYEQLLADNDTLVSERLSLFRNIALPSHKKPKAYDSLVEACRTEHVNRYLGHMDSRQHDGGRKAFPLDPSQRDALIAMSMVRDGELLAVNGPPGTGKTSLMRAVIASEWIKPLLGLDKEPKCPVVLACAATNQAVTNIISSFSEVPATALFDEQGERTSGVSASTEARWLPHLSSYGWFAPASLREDKQAELATYQVITRERADKPWQFHYASELWGEITTARAETAFLSCAREYFQCDVSISDVALRLRAQVQGTAKQCAELEHALNEWFQKLETLRAHPWTESQSEEHESSLQQWSTWDDEQGARNTFEKSVSFTRQQIRDLQEVSSQVAALARKSLFGRLKRAIFALFDRQAERNRWEELRSALCSCGVVLPDSEPAIESWQDAIQLRVAELQKQLGNKLAQYKAQNDVMMLVRQKLSELSTRRDLHQRSFDQARLAKDLAVNILRKMSPDDAGSIVGLLSEGLDRARHANDDGGSGLSYQARLLKVAQEWLDTNVRPTLFHLTARYWEARYLLYRKELEQRIANNVSAEVASDERLRELAMLAPVFVVTSYSAPKLMRRAITSYEDFDVPYLFGMADLLIVDEAGQGTSEVGACAFAFAKRAIVVGDVNQLEPVWSFEEPADRLLVKKHKLHKRAHVGQSDGYEELRHNGSLLANGAIMRMAQNATAVSDVRFTDTPGLTLTNHYRCRAPIIDICNSMVYHDVLRVVPESTEPKQEWRPPLGFLVVQGSSTQIRGGSRCNHIEAERIAQWINEMRDSLVTHYNRDRIGDSLIRDLPELVAILTPFKGQIPVLREAVANALGENLRDRMAIANRMVIGTVHSLQGAEKPVVVFSMVETATPSEKQFYDKGTNLINVAISRAKEMFVVAMDQAAVDYARKLIKERLRKPSDHLWFNIVRNGQRLDSRRVVLIESPNKREHIETALRQGMELEVLATSGHLTELDTSQEWDPLTASEPRWASLSENEFAIYQRIATLWSDLEALYIATDPDAEGECIAWHFLNRVQEHLPMSEGDDLTRADSRMPSVKRMRFNALTPEVIREAYETAGEGLDAGMVKSALARNFLDQIIARHYPAKLGLTKPNTFHVGIGRVQLGILDLVNKSQQKPKQYVVNVKLSSSDKQSLDFYLAKNAREGAFEPVLFDDAKRAEGIGNVIKAKMSEADLLKVDKCEHVRRVEEYPAINTGRFLALATRSTKMTPKQVMDALQAIYESKTDDGVNEDMP